jgi:L-asparaginase II
MPTVVQHRGRFVESRHPFSVACARAGGEVTLAGPALATTFRSASKPFQLATSLEVLGLPDVDEAWLAVGAASHNAEPRHVALVEAILARFGVEAAGLRCGAHAPVHVPSAEAVLRAGGACSALHNNCSGKHAFMLAAARHAGWAEDYRPLSHPLQQRVLERLRGWAGEVTGTATDGCGVPTFYLPLEAVARSWRAVAEAMRAQDAVLGRIGWAMARHPELTSGEGRLDLDVVRHAREPLAVKVGAMGLFCMALPERGLALSVKVEPGTNEALPAAVAWALAHFAKGSFAPPEDWTHLQVRNVVGDVVGRWSAEP